MNEQIRVVSDHNLRGLGDLRPAYGVWDWDLAGNVIYADEMAAQIFGVDARLAKKGLPPETYFQAIHADDRQMIIDHSLQSISTFGACADNFRVLHDDGTKWVHSQGRCFADRENKAKCFVGLIAELTQSFAPGRGAHPAPSVGGTNDDILYLSLYAKRIANETNRPFVAYLLDMVIAEVTDLKALGRC